MNPYLKELARTPGFFGVAMGLREKFIIACLPHGFARWASAMGEKFIIARWACAMGFPAYHMFSRSNPADLFGWQEKDADVTSAQAKNLTSARGEDLYSSGSRA